ncbi:MAG: GlxA family transcriptional regulator [Acidimicrobiales bacterium]
MSDSSPDTKPEHQFGSSQTRQGPSHALAIVAYDGMQALDLAGPHEVFDAANRVADASGHPGLRYRLQVIGPEGTHVTTESGLRLMADPLPDPFELSEPIDTLVIPGGDSARTADEDHPVVRWAANVAPRIGRLACVCTGAFIAANAGLLEGREITTHWARGKELARRYPEITVRQDAIYIEDHNRPGAVWSSAGVTAGIDLALAMVESDLGTEVAQEVARWLVVFLRRPGGQSQFAPTVWSKRSTDGPIRQAQDLIDLDPAQIESMAALAAEVGLSSRHFARRFQSEIGVSPARYLEQVRISAARQHLESTTDGVAIIAERCGFGSAETLRRVFQRRLSVSPDDYRRRFAAIHN